MRQTHLNNPLHRIEYWTGRYFRAAHLWEVGVYILIEHHHGIPLCDHLVFQRTNLETLQRLTDGEEQVKLCSEEITRNFSESAMDGTTTHPVSLPQPRNVSQPANGQGANVTRTASGIAEFESTNVAELESNVAERESTNVAEPEYNVAEPQYNVAELESTHAWSENRQTNWHSNWDGEDVDIGEPEMDATDAAGNHGGNPAAGNIPRVDAMNNHYVRVVHVNGIHHLPLVTCNFCRSGGLQADLVYCQFIPTSFSRYRTLFTVMVLDDFRLTNLECKASAYQYFEKLRRLTSPMAPATAPHLYQELIRMSRAWRWMKKLKWAGYGHGNDNLNEPKPGELANLCPACPQVGINLPAGWEEDPNR